MVENVLAGHLGHYVDLSAGERDALAAIEVGERHYRRGALVRAEQDAAAELIVVRRGWLFSSLNLEDGRRQIIRLHLSGDLLGTDLLAYAAVPDTIVAATDAEVVVLDKVRFCRLFATHPRLAALLYLLQQVDRVAVTDRLVSIGRSSARGRVAALLLWVCERLRIADPALDDTFPLPLTQEEIGDLTGLTAVHVNRTMRVLAEEGLVTRRAGIVRIVDRERLAATANYIARRQRFDLSCLPAAG